ncbi:uncharacterized protein TNCT_227111 [Trichonephila clavata]|uniref:Uncharacterized protein n=1 Tax=Trichonephila clavata TaxID=2740835 RepID=A0A8X6H2E0_TRICU|nr:uncharacterized protein TNCT_227111 [Trichonephila clavata]
MGISFWPPLQLIAYTKIAQGILYTFDLEILKYGFTSVGLYQNYVLQIEKKVSSIILPVNTSKRDPIKAARRPCLPIEVQKQVVGLVMVLSLEIENWFDCHKSFLFGDDLYLRKRIAWYSNGIVDRFKTAQIFIEDESLSIKRRFQLAFKYYFEKNARKLWENMPLDDKDCFMEGNRGSFFHYWLKQCSIGIDWSTISLTTRGQEFFYSNYLGLRYFFTQVKGSEIRFQCVSSALESEMMHHFDMSIIISRMNVHELNATLVRLTLKQVYKFFECFLQWPLQIIFMDVVNQFKGHITEDIFFDLVQIILFDKLRKQWKDHQYVDLLKPFWYSMPSNYRDYVNEDSNLQKELKLHLKSCMS